MGLGLGIALGGLAGGLGSMFGADRAASTQGEYNAVEAAKNRDFQRQMSNTAYTRAARDLDRAGLNRILALGNPASTPAGS